MAFYKDAPGKTQKRNYANEGAWEEEGRSYSGRNSSRGGDRRNGAGEHNAQKSFGASRGKERSFGERKSFGPGAPRKSFERNDSPRKSFDRNDGARKSFDRSAPRRFDDRPRKPVEAPAERTFRDYQYTAPVAPAPAAVIEERETDLPRENLLVGRNPIREALRSGRDIEKLLVQKGELSGSAREIVAAARERHIIVQEVEKTRLDEIAPHHQGMLAFASAYQYSTVEAMLETAAERGEDPFLILLDGVTDPHNLGAIIRSAECVGAHGVIVPERRSVGLTPAAVKASAGAVEHIKVARVTNLNRTIEDLKAKNVWTYALDMDGRDYMSIDFKGGVALVVGAEGEGVSRLTLESCDTKVSLPMEGVLDSLNASVAAGVMMYRVLASRKA